MKAKIPFTLLTMLLQVVCLSLWHVTVGECKNNPNTEQPTSRILNEELSDCRIFPSNKPITTQSSTKRSQVCVESENQNPQLNKTEIIQKTRELHIPFIANTGQSDERVKFYANIFGGSLFVTKDGEIVYSLPSRDDGQETRVRGQGSGDQKTGYGPRVIDVIQQEFEILDLFLISYSNPISKMFSLDTDHTFSHSKIQNPKSEISGLALKETLVGGKVNKIKGEGKAVTTVNYFKGKDPSQWKTNISTYEVVNLGEVYKGIELKLRAYGNNIEKLFYVKSGINPEMIKLSLSGAKDLKVNDAGELEVETELGLVKFTKPVAYQEIDGKRVEVAVEYSIQNPRSEIPQSEIYNPYLTYGFKVAAYDKTKELVIDPLLASTYLGGVGDEVNGSIAIDSSGSIYVTGQTGSSDFPTTTGVYDTFLDSEGEAFVSKLSGDLTTLLVSTFLGGSSGGERIDSIAIDSKGNIYATGFTYSSDFPTTPGAYDTSYDPPEFNSNFEAFVSKLSGDLTTLLASTYLGGSYDDYGHSIAIDSSGNVFVVGQTHASPLTKSSDFPTTTGAYDTSSNGLEGYRDAFISKLNEDLTILLASTFLGGSYDDSIWSCNLDSSGSIYVTGSTGSSDFPTTTGAYDTSLGGSGDAFISKLNGDLTTLLASTYLGGSYDDYGHSIAIDSSGNIYVTGDCRSSDFPTTTDAYDTSLGGSGDAFISKLSGDLTNILASTYLGGPGSSEYGTSIAIDSAGNIVLCGSAASDFPTTTGAYDTSHGGSYDVFISKLNGDLTTLLESTYLGGIQQDTHPSVAIDASGNIYITGFTYSSDFPTTTRAYDTSYAGSPYRDAFVSMFDSDLSGATPTPTSSLTPIPIPSPTPPPNPTPTPSPARHQPCASQKI